MADAKTKTNESAPMTGDPKIDAIKQLIFGDNMIEYDQEFDTIKELIAKTKTEIESNLAEQNKNLTSDINSLKAALEKSIAALEKSTTKEMARLNDAKANRKALGKMLLNIGDKLMQ